MTALPGGAADKAGNRFEHLWTAQRLADLLEGRASRMRLEPPGAAGSGIEFAIDMGGISWGEQAKASPENWTIRRLVTEGVLPAARAQLDLGRGFRLVAAAGSRPLAALADRSRSAESFEEFSEIVGSGRLAEDLSDLASAWNVPKDESWQLLRRVEVEHIPADALDRIVTTTFKRLYVEDPELVIAGLRDFCDTHLHETFTAPQVAEYLRAAGFRSRLLAGDPDTLRRLHRTIERQQRRVDSAAPFTGLVDRNDARVLVERLRADGPQITIVDGAAGTGKSAVVADVAATLETGGWFVVVARMDTHVATTTSDHLGASIGLSESPTVLLAGVADGSPALLVIDQLDAVSVYSGRMSDNFDAVAEVLDEIQRAPHVKALLVVRTVDLEVDPRLRALLNPPGRVARQTIGQLPAADVRSYLVEHGMAVPAEATVELLRTPLHLAVFARLSADARDVPFRTLQELYDVYTEELRRRVEDRLGRLDWTMITGALVTQMSDNEVLTAPAGVLDAAARDEVGALESESFLVRDDAGIAFFHESYFDYLFARSFIASGGNLHTFLAASGQHLFRRAQARHVLEHLAATDRARFRAVTADLLAAADIRPHLKDVTVGVLRNYRPEADDWLALDTLAWNGTPIGYKLLNLLSSPAWFDAADAAGLWERWLADPATVDGAFNQLAFAARDRGRRAAQLVTPYIGVSEDWRLRLRGMIVWSINAELVDLAVELVDRGLLDDAKGPIAINSDFWSVVYHLERDDAEGATRLTGAYLRRGLDRAHADGSADPFESGHLEVHSQTASVIADIARKAPASFVAEVLPFVAEVATANQHHIDQRLPAGRRWAFRHVADDYTVDDAVFSATGDALCRLSTDDPERFGTIVAPLRDSESEELRFLACRAITAGVAAGTVDVAPTLDWLLSDARNLALGWSDSPHWATRELLAACAARASRTQIPAIESIVLSYAPDWETRRSRGHAQYELLSAIDPDALSETARRRLGELERRFASWSPQPPRPVEAHFVGPPIPEEASARMSDDDWLRALRKHNTDETDWSGDLPVGGALQLARMLGRRAKEDPARFAALALRFDAEIPASAINDVIPNVADGVDAELLTDLCVHAHQLYGAHVGRTVCDAARRIGAGNGRIARLVDHYTHDADPDRELARTVAGSDGQYFYGGDLLNAGLNSTRGQAVLAAASLVHASGEHLDLLLPAIERLAVDDILAVRVCAADAVIALLNRDPDHALTLAEELFDTDIDVLDAHPTESLLRYGTIRAPDRFALTLARALAGPESVAIRGGHIWAVLSYRGDLRTPVATDISDLPVAARAGAAAVFAHNASDSIGELAALFDDGDAEVRKQASLAMYEIDEIPDAELEPLIAAFVKSRAFADHMDQLIHSLERRASKLPPSTIEVCEEAVAVGGRDLGDIRTASAIISRDLITVILRLYRQGDPPLRTRCLDLVDRLTELNAYDVYRALDDER